MDKKTKLAIMMNNLGKPKEPLSIEISFKLNNFNESWITAKNNYNFLIHNLNIFNKEFIDGDFGFKNIQDNEEEEDENNKLKPDNWINFYRKEKTIELENKETEIKIINENNKIKNEEETNDFIINLKFKLNKDEIINFENKTYEKEDWIEGIELVRYPQLEEDELNKIKKKAKGDQINFLNKTIFKADLNLSELKIPGNSNIKSDLKFNLIEGEANLGENFISSIEIKLNRSINPFIKEIFPKLSNISNLNLLKKNYWTDVENAKKLLEQKFILIFNILSKEYNKVNKNLNENILETNRNNFLSNQEKEKIIYEKRENFIKMFLKTKQYDLIKDEIIDLIHELVYDKILKETSISKDNNKILKIVNEVYVYLKKVLSKQMSEFLNNIKNNNNSENNSIIDDISSSFKIWINKNNLDKDKLSEVELEKKLNLIKEYEILGNNYLVNIKFQDYIILDKNNLELWQKYSIFNLKNHNYVMGELCLKEAIEILSKSEDRDENRLINLKTYYLCLLLRRERYNDFEKGILEILNHNKRSIKHNVLMSFFYSEYKNNPKRGKKYFNVAFKIYKKEIKNEEKTLEEIKEDLWLKLIFFLFNNTIIFLCEKLIDKIQNQILKKFLLSNIIISKKKYDESNIILNEILELDPNNPNAIKTKAANNYFLGRLFEAEELFLNYFKMDKKNKDDFEILLILGNSYLRRKSFLDAKIIFKKSCSLEPESYSSWLGLGISCLKLKDYEESEEALLNANLYDPINIEVFGYITILFLKWNRINEAENVFNNMLNYKIFNLYLLLEIGEEFIKYKLYEKSIYCFEKIINENNNEILDLLINKGINKNMLIYKVGDLNYLIKNYENCKYYFNKYLENSTDNYYNDKIINILNEIENN